MRPSHRSRFTLIELLVVISIVSMLASVVLAAMGGARDKATIASMQMFDTHTYQALGANLVGMWNFDGDYNDSSGNGHNGTAVGGVSPTNNASNQSNKASLFDGTSGYVDVGILDISNDITVSTWVNPTNTNNNIVIGIVSKPINSGSGSVQWALYINANALNWKGFGSASLSCAPPSNNKWHHIATTQTGTMARIYIDGKLCNSGTIDTISNNSMQVYIGKFCTSCNSTNYFKGAIDDVKIYSQYMLASEIQNIYLAGLPTHTLAENTGVNFPNKP